MRVFKNEMRILFLLISFAIFVKGDEYLCSSVYLPNCSTSSSRYCLETPNDSGVTTCTLESDCSLGRFCEEGVCQGEIKFTLVSCPENSSCAENQLPLCSVSRLQTCQENYSDDQEPICNEDQDCSFGRVCEEGTCLGSIENIELVDCSTLPLFQAVNVSEVPISQLSQFANILSQNKFPAETVKEITDEVKNNEASLNPSITDESLLQGIRQLDSEDLLALRYQLINYQKNLDDSTSSSLKTEVMKTLAFVNKEIDNEAGVDPNESEENKEEVSLLLDNSQNDSNEDNVEASVSSNEIKTKESDDDNTSEVNNDQNDTAIPIIETSEDENTSEVNNDKDDTAIPVLEASEDDESVVEENNNKPLIAKNDNKFVAELNENEPLVEENESVGEDNANESVAEENNNKSVSEENDTVAPIIINSREKESIEDEDTDNTDIIPIVEESGVEAEEPNNEITDTNKDEIYENITEEEPQPLHHQIYTSEEIERMVPEYVSSGIEENEDGDIVEKFIKMPGHSPNLGEDGENEAYDKVLSSMKGQEAVSIISLYGDEEDEEDVETMTSQLSEEEDQKEPKDEDSSTKDIEEPETEEKPQEELKDEESPAEIKEEPIQEPVQETDPRLNSALMKILATSDSLLESVPQNENSDMKSINELVEDISLDLAGDVEYTPRAESNCDEKLTFPSDKNRRRLKGNMKVPIFNSLIRILNLYRDSVAYQQNRPIAGENYRYLENVGRNLECLTASKCNYTHHYRILSANNKKTEVKIQEEGWLCRWFGFKCIAKNRKLEKSESSVKKNHVEEASPKNNFVCRWFGLLCSSVNRKLNATHTASNVTTQKKSFFCNWFNLWCPAILRKAESLKTNSGNYNSEASGLFSIASSRRLSNYLNAHDIDDTSQAIRHLLQFADVNEEKNKAKLDELVEKNLAPIKELTSSEEVRQKSEEVIQNLKNFALEIQDQADAEADNLDSNFNLIRDNISTLKEMDGEKLKAILGMLEGKAQYMLTDEFTKKGLSSRADYLLGVVKRLKETKEKAEANLPLDGVLSKDIDSLVSVLQDQIGILSEASNSSEDELLEAREIVLKDLKAKLAGIDTETNSEALQKLGEKLEAIDSSALGQSLNADNIKSIVHKVTASFLSDLSKLDSPAKKSGYILDTDDLEYLTENVIDELKISREDNQQVTIQLKNVEEALESITAKVAFKLNPDRKPAQQAADLFINYENVLSDVLSSDSFYDQLKDYVQRYYSVLKAHTSEAAPIFEHSEVFKTLTKGMLEKDGEVRTSRRLKSIYSTVFRQLKVARKLSNQDKKFFTMFNRLLADLTLSPSSTYQRKLEIVYRVLKGENVEFRKLRLSNYVQQRKLGLSFANIKEYFNDLLEDYVNSKEAADTILEKLDKAKKGSHNLEKILATLSSNTSTSNKGSSVSSIFSKIKFWRRVETKNRKLFENPLHTVRELVNDLSKGISQANKMREDLQGIENKVKSVSEFLPLA